MSVSIKPLIQGLCLASFTLAGICAAHEVAHDSAEGHTDDGPHFERAKSDGKVIITGGAKTPYLWESDWLKLPEQREWLGSTHGCIVTDAKDNVFLSADSGDAIQVFDKHGNFVRSFGADWGAGVHGLSIVTEAKEVITESEGMTENVGVLVEALFVAHTAKQRVFKTTLTGEVLLELEFPTASGKYENRASYKPTSVAVAPDGRLFVADGYGLSWIHIYSADGIYLSSFGGPGEGPENLRTPHGLWLDTHGETPTLLVSDRENHRIARFSLDGKFLGGTDPESGLLRRPCHLQFAGDVAVVADLAGRVTLLNEKLELITHLGDNPDATQHANFGVTPDKWRDGAFLAPHCARIDSAGNLLVMDWNVAGRITRLVPLFRIEGE
ncbi:MAG: hypothetical protein ACI9D0_001744 [Bacteroidia bacterium]|jgi:hypothetical protein